MVEKGKGISFQEYRSGIEKQNELIHQLDRLLDRYDIIITLSTAGEAPRGLHTLDKGDSCLIWTLCHTLAINLPLFKGPNNLPFGAQIISRRLKDYDLLDFARYLEKEGLFRDWKEV
jgi:Asp-tRNA(Asn)/Glu-tRNA(Gln) amidotransferase A subunit family amidase